MIVSSSPPLQRVHEIFQRMQTETENVECLKTCCGALAILAKDEANKLLIARDGTRLILTVMEGHATRPDLQEAVCDLLWSLAFNNGLVKEVVGRQGGIALILKGMSSHLSSPEVVKSACGALSNMCQNTYNQNLIAAHGGVRTILSALHSHRMNSPLLPFVFDALASLIVGNQRNGLLVTDGGGIRGVLTTMGLHTGRREVVKSGCHALAILSDIQGQGARIAGADGVKVLLPALRAHVRFLHLHRIAAIVLLRMLQEATVARDIAYHGGVVIMLGMLREHVGEQETVAATVHILYLITHADVMRGGVEEEVARHFSGLPPAYPSPSNGGIPRAGVGGLSSVRGSMAGSCGMVGGTNSSGAAGAGGAGSMSGTKGVECSSVSDRELFGIGSVRALVLVLQAHMQRKDIVRAAMRSAANLVCVRPVVQALIAETAALPTILQCLALHSTSRGITDSAVSVAGALLAAAHANGWASRESAPTWGYKGYLENGVNGGSHPGGGCTRGSGGADYKLSVLGPAPSSTSMGNMRQHPASRQSSQSLLVGGPASVGLRFAYVPLHDIRGGATLETGLRGQGSKRSTGSTVVANGGISIAQSSNPGAATGGGDASASPASPTTSAEGAGVGFRSTPGDAGMWNASMQALCAMLRAKRRDVALTGLVFLALEACVCEWAQACNIGPEKTNARGGRGDWRPVHLGPPTAAAAAAATVGAAEEAEAAAAKGNTVSSPPSNAAQDSGTRLSSGAKAVGLNIFPKSERSPPRSERLVQGQGGRVGAGPREKEVIAAATAKEKMKLGTREALKAGLVWAEAVPLGRPRPSGDGADRRGAGPGDRGGLSSASSHVSQTTAADTASTGLTFNSVVAESVSRLCRLLNRGFAELGFGRFGDATPLSETAALKLFDTNVSQVLGSLRAAQQPDSSREAVEALIRTFLPAEPPQPPPFEAQTSGAAAAGSAAAAALSLSAGGNKNSDGRLIAAAATRASDISGGVRGPSSLQQRRLTAGKATAGGGSAMAGSTGDVKRSGAGAGDASSVRGGEVIRGADSGVFWDEAGAGGAGLVSSSPLDLEPILPPSSCSGLLSGRPSPSTAASPNAAARALATGTGGAMGSLFSGGLGTMASRFSGGAGATVTGAPGGNTDDQLWLVYEGTSAAGKGVVSRVNAPDPYWLGRASPGAVCPHPHSMEFYSAFEGANLLRAVQRGPAEYDLFLRPDLHTHGHTQWFYFAVRGTHPPGIAGDSVVKFNVVNLTKPDSLFAMGMRPVLYSHRDAAGKGLGWQRCGQSIDYRSNGYTWYKPDGSQASFYTLSLSITFPNPGDTYRLAHAHPYSYSDHKRHLAGLLADERTSRYINHTVLCQTLGGNECDLLTVTEVEDTPIATGSSSETIRVAQSSSTPLVAGQTNVSPLHQPREQAVGSISADTQNILDGPAAAITGASSATMLGIGLAAQGGTPPGSAGVGDYVSGPDSDTAAGGVPGTNGIGSSFKQTAGGTGGANSTGRRGGGNSKRCIVISARVHPGEVPASWMMRGMLDFLTGESIEARLLRSLFVFKIVPMLNPDGVAFGNNRCSLAGVDLNRQWKRPSRTLHPTVFWLKHQVRQEQGKKGVAMYIDLHGHSRKMNIFMYGADEKRRGVSCPSARVFPKLLSWNRLGRKYVSFKDCSFAVKKGRESTARVVVARDLGIGNSYTVESTFCGVDFGPLKDHHLNIDHLQEAGVAICDALLDYYVPNHAQRERAHRDLAVKNVSGNAGLVIGLLSTPPADADAVATSAAGCDVDGGHSSDSGRAGGINGGEGGEEEGEEKRQGEAGGGGHQSSEPRDADDDVVDNNDDLESEDDNDSEPPETSPEEYPENAVDPLRPPQHSTDFVSDAATAATTAAATITTTTATENDKTHRQRDQEIIEAITDDSNASVVRHGDLATIGDGGSGGNTDLWPRIEWGEGEIGGATGIRGGLVRRWGRVVEEVIEPPPNTESEQSSPEESENVRGLVKKTDTTVEYFTTDRGGATTVVASAAAAAAAAVRAAVEKQAAAAAGEGGGGLGRRDKQRGSGRAPKSLSISKGHRGGRDIDYVSAGRYHRPRGHATGGDSTVARRASDAALQAASHALAICSSSNLGGGTVKFRRRIRSLQTNNGSGGGSRGGNSHGGSGSGSSTRSTGEGARGRGRGGGIGPAAARGLDTESPAADEPGEGDITGLAPTSGSGLDPERGAEPVAAADAADVVVNRGGNPRWLSFTDPTASGGDTEGGWSGVGSLPSNFPRRLVNPAQSHLPERNMDSPPLVAGLGAPELGMNDSARGGGSGSDVGRSVKGAAAKVRVRGNNNTRGSGTTGRNLGDKSIASPSMAILALPILDDGGGGGGGEGRAGGGRQAEDWGRGLAGENPRMGGLFSARPSVAVPGRGES